MNWFITDGWSWVKSNTQFRWQWNSWGDGDKGISEQWDALPANDPDNCWVSWALQPGWSWILNGRVWAKYWPNGKLESNTGEEWDDGNEDNGDGWDKFCKKEIEYSCTRVESQLSVWKPIWGDSIIVGDEEWDDGNTDNGDGWSSTGTIEIIPNNPEPTPTKEPKEEKEEVKEKIKEDNNVIIDFRVD